MWSVWVVLVAAFAALYLYPLLSKIA